MTESHPQQESLSKAVPDDRLESWKEIASYLKRDVTTVQRWEKKEGLPVHRHVHEKKSSVYAFRSELDSWLAQRGTTDAVGGMRNWLSVAALLLTVVIGAAFLLNVGGLRDRLAAEPSSRIDSIAVLPLENLSGDPEQEYFVDGMTDELISQLAQVRSLRVISRTSIMQYKDARKSLPEIARELDVDVVVEGTVRRAEGRVRITVQLVEASTDRQLWAQSFERGLRDVLVLQSEIARAIANEVRATLTPDEEIRLAAAHPVNPEAHEAYLKGRYHHDRVTVENLRKSVSYLETAIALDPNYGAAYAALAQTYSLMPNLFVVSPEEGFTKAKDLARKALSLDATLEDAHLALGWSLACFDHDWRQAEDAFRRVVELAPNSAFVHSRYGWFLSWLGRHNEALRERALSSKLDPLSAIIGHGFGVSLIVAHRYDEAIDQINKNIALHPDDFFSHLRLGRAYALKGSYQEALAALEKADALTDDPVRPKDQIASLYALMGREEQARQVLEKILATEEGRRAPFNVSWIYVALGERDKALEHLEKAYELHDPNLVLLKVWPHLDPIRDDPRFQDLLRRMNFPE